MCLKSSKENEEESEYFIKDGFKELKENLNVNKLLLDMKALSTSNEDYASIPVIIW